MPGATSIDFWPRIVVDEASFDFREFPDMDVEHCLDQFNDALDTLLRTGQIPAVYSDYSIMRSNAATAWSWRSFYMAEILRSIRTFAGALEGC